MKHIKIATQKKFLFLPFMNFVIIWIFFGMNIKYLKTKGIDFGFLNYKFIFREIIYIVFIQIIYGTIVRILSCINIPSQFDLILGIFILYINFILISWQLIKRQRKLGIEE